MLTKHQDMLFLLLKLSEDTPPEMALGITYLDDSSLWAASGDDILFIIHSTVAFANNSCKPTRFHAYFSYRYASAVFNKLQSRQLREKKTDVPIFAMLADRNN